MSSMKTNLKNIAGMAVLIGTILFVTTCGLGDVFDIAMGNVAVTDLSNDTWAAFGSDGVDSIERVSTIFVAVAGLSAIGLIGVSRSNPKAVNDIIRFTPAAAAAVCLTNFRSDFMELISGDFVWSAHNEGYIGMLLVLSGYTVWTVVNMLQQRSY